MSLSNLTFDDVDQFVNRFHLDPTGENQENWMRKDLRKPKKSKKEVALEVGAVSDQTAPSGDVKMTYQPARYETVWLRESLQGFYEQGLIDDVLMLVKGGKEANVYLCQSAADHTKLFAAKVYRPRQFRNLRNDKMYREGRELLNSLGVPIKNRDNREMRAIAKKTEFGAELTHISWLMHEYVTLQRIHRLGAAVPEPIAAGENSILMGYVGDRQRPAPALHAVALNRHEAGRLSAKVLDNVEMMLRNGMIHGDLSAYNILYWRGDVTLIDFPQVTFAESNSSAYKILLRDVQRVCEYFAACGVQRHAEAIVHDLWEKYVRLPPGGRLMEEVLE